MESTLLVVYNAHIVEQTMANPDIYSYMSRILSESDQACKGKQPQESDKKPAEDQKEIPEKEMQEIIEKNRAGDGSLSAARIPRRGIPKRWQDRM